MGENGFRKLPMEKRISNLENDINGIKNFLGNLNQRMQHFHSDSIKKDFEIIYLINTLHDQGIIKHEDLVKFVELNLKLTYLEAQIQSVSTKNGELANYQTIKDLMKNIRINGKDLSERIKVILRKIFEKDEKFFSDLLIFENIKDKSPEPINVVESSEEIIPESVLPNEEMKNTSSVEEIEIND